MSGEIQALLLATGNTGKVREMRDLLADLPLTIRTLHDFPDLSPVDETGTTFRENAELKAIGYAMQTGEFALADDSGLEVEALGGAPGVYSARYAGEGAGYDIKMTKLLDALDATGDAARRARFVCAMAIADPNGRLVAVTEGVCPGVIATSPRGAGGFGYDPIFVPDGFDLTFGELDQSAKQEISHRSRAAKLIMRYLPDFIAV